MTHNPMYHVIKDPVHGTMQFTNHENQWVKPFINHVNFQRLRHIKQLGMGDYIFPGAVHTRFNHSLGCCYVASQIAAKIGLAEEERQLVMIASLLHDIGHGPFSHAFEDVFHQKLIRHEAWTSLFLADFHADFFQQYNRINPRHPLTEEKFALIENMIMHKTHIKNVLADIVSSQLDADRLDYLLRDSHFCGVQYGEFDLSWMLHCLAIVNSPHGERLGITHKGIGVVEHYLMARRLMMRNIYHLQKKLAIEFFLIKLLTNLAENLESYAQYATVKSTRIGKFLLAAHQFNQVAAHFSEDKKMQQEFLQKNYEIYKELNDYDVIILIKTLAEMHNHDAATEIAKRIDRRVMPKIIRLDHADVMSVQQQLTDFKKTYAHDFQDWQISLIKTPHQSYSVEDDPILVVNEHSEVKPINEISVMINAISDKFEMTTFLCIDQAIFTDNRVEKFIRMVTAPLREIS